MAQWKTICSGEWWARLTTIARYFYPCVGFKNSHDFSLIKSSSITTFGLNNHGIMQMVVAANSAKLPQHLNCLLQRLN